ncbi:MAG TPA: response regulator [Tepidisphaeraceae bacterium]|jgi:signal transduction histidine kinase|nr:response regulator [Tepidisphaeraceae bacterium]
MAGVLRVLLVEDVEADAILLLRELKRGDWEVRHARVDTASGMTEALRTGTWDLIIADHALPTFSGLEALLMARRSAGDVPFFLVSGVVGEETAVEALKAGANDYLFKGNLRRLCPAVERELRDAEGRRESRRLETELHARESQLADAYRLAHLGGWHMDFRTGAAVCSDESNRILAGENAEPIQTVEAFLDCLHPDDRRSFREVLNHPRINRLIQDFRNLCPDRSVRFCHIRGDVTRDATGAAVEAAGTLQDITERKSAEEALRKAHDELALASKAKDHFLAVLSHELRTPLTPVLALVSQLETQSNLSEDLRADLGTIRRNVQLEAKLIDDLLDLTRIIRDKLALHFEVVDAHRLVREALELFHKEIDGKAMTVTVGLDARRNHVWADPARLRQVVVNLLSNAVKFTPAGGTIHVRSADHGDRFRLQVMDTGVGIEPQFLPRLFQMFEQGDRSSVGRVGGLGLGLSIAKSLIELQGGSITAESAGPGKGAALSIELAALPATAAAEEPPPPRAIEPAAGSLPAPAAAADPSGAQTPPAAAAPGRMCRVLLVEDHEDTRRVMARLLKIAGYTVTLAGSVKEAIEAANKYPFELLLSDIGLPDGSGADIMRHIKRTTTIKGIALSGFGQEEDLRKSREAGFETHLTKPVDFQKLQDVMQRVAG